MTFEVYPDINSTFIPGLISSSLSLSSEPFISGIPEMIDYVVREIPDAREGFRLMFSAGPFPGYEWELVRVRDESEGA